MNKKALAYLVASEAFFLILLVLFLSELVSNVSTLAWVLQLIMGTAAIFNGSIIVNELATRGERK